MRKDGNPHWSKTYGLPLGIGALSLVGSLVAFGFARFAENRPWGDVLIEVGGASLSGGVIAVGVGFGLLVVERQWQDAEERRSSHQAQREADHATARDFVGRALHVHNTMASAQLRLRAHATVKTYGEEIRVTVMPAMAEMSRLKSDIRASADLYDAKKHPAAAEAEGVFTYLKHLADEYAKDDRYLRFSRWQAISSKRQSVVISRIGEQGCSMNDMSEEAREAILTGEPFRLNADDRPTVRIDDSEPWRELLLSSPRLRVFCEDQPPAKSVHQEEFSDPIGRLMNNLDGGARGASEPQ